MRPSLYPIKPVRAVLSLVVIGGGMLAAARASGLGTVQTTGLAIASLGLAAFMAPAYGLKKARIEVLAHPSDVTSGKTFNVVLRSNEAVVVQIPALSVKEAPCPAQKPAALACSAKRGVITAVCLKVRSAAPFGIFWWERKVELKLSSPIYVHPRPGRIRAELLRPAGTAVGRGGLVSLSRGFEIKGVREYRAGDSLRDIHWKLSAHSLSLLTKLKESESSGSFLIKASHEAGIPFEELVCDLFSTGRDALSRGERLIVEVVRAGTPRVLEVKNALELGRQLALAE